MPSIERSNLRCVMLSPLLSNFNSVRHAIKSAALESNVQLVSVTESIPNGMAQETFSTVVQADLVIAVVSYASPNVFYEVGLAHATGKPVIFIYDEEASRPYMDARHAQSLSYVDSPKSLLDLKIKLRQIFNEYRRDPT